MEKTLSTRFLNSAIVITLINVSYQFVNSINQMIPDLFNLSTEVKKNSVFVGASIIIVSSTFLLIYLWKKKYIFPFFMILACTLCGSILGYFNYQFEHHGKFLFIAGYIYFIYCFLVIITGVSFFIRKANERRLLKSYGILLIVCSLISVLGVLLISLFGYAYSEQILQYTGMVASLAPILLILNYHSEKFLDNNLKTNDDIVDADL